MKAAVIMAEHSYQLLPTLDELNNFVFEEDDEVIKLLERRSASVWKRCFFVTAQSLMYRLKPCLATIPRLPFVGEVGRL